MKGLLTLISSLSMAPVSAEPKHTPDEVAGGKGKIGLHVDRGLKLHR